MKRLAALIRPFLFLLLALAIGPALQGYADEAKTSLSIQTLQVQALKKNIRSVDDPRSRSIRSIEGLQAAISSALNRNSDPETVTTARRLISLQNLRVGSSALCPSIQQDYNEETQKCETVRCETGHFLGENYELVKDGPKCEERIWDPTGTKCSWSGQPGDGSLSCTDVGHWKTAEGRYKVSEKYVCGADGKGQLLSTDAVCDASVSKFPGLIIPPIIVDSTFPITFNPGWLPGTGGAGPFRTRSLAVHSFAARSSEDCQAFQEPGTSLAEIFEGILFSKNDSLLAECMGLASKGTASSDVQEGLAHYFITNPKKAAQESVRTQLEAWVKSTNDKLAINQLSLAFGLACQPSDCLLRDPSFEAIQKRLLTASDHRRWLSTRIAMKEGRGVSFGQALGANTQPIDDFEKRLLKAFAMDAIYDFEVNPNLETAGLLQAWMVKTVSSLESHSYSLETKENPTAFDLIALMQDLHFIRAISTSATPAAASKNLVLLRSKAFPESAKSNGVSWKDIIEKAYPSFWKALAQLQKKKVDLGDLDSAAFESQLLSLLIEPEFAGTAAEAFSYLSFNALAASPGSNRIGQYMKDWGEAFAIGKCTPTDKACRGKAASLLVFAARPDAPVVSENDAASLRTSLIKADSKAVLNVYESIVSTMAEKDMFACGSADATLEAPCVTFGTVLAKILKPLTMTIQSQYASLPSNDQNSSMVNLLQFVDSYEAARIFGLEDGKESANSLTHKLISVAAGSRLDVKAAYEKLKLMPSASRETSLFHQAICRRISVEPKWIPAVSSELGIRRLARNAYALNRLLSLHLLSDQHKRLSWGNPSDVDTLVSSFYEHISRPVLPAACSSAVPISTMTKVYQKAGEQIRTYFEKQELFMGHDLFDMQDRVD